MRQLTPPIVILALNLDTIEKELKLINDWGFKAKSVKGFYKGRGENSYVLEINDYNHLKIAETLATSNGQECILYSDDFRKTWLIYTNGERKYLGILHSVSEQEALKYDGYTFDHSTSSYWITDNENS